MGSSRPVPFLLNTESEISKFREETFWTKEPETIQWIDDNLGSKFSCDTFIDVGANIGIYSLYAATFNQDIPIVAVEPIVFNFQELERNIDLNHFRNQITPLNIALSDDSGTGSMDIRDSRVGSSGAQLMKGFDSQSEGIQFLSGDQLLDGSSLRSGNASKRVMIKIDTDGNEYDVLKGFSNSFSDHRIQTVLCETHPANIAEIETLMSDLGFVEDVGYLKIKNHSNQRRIEKGNTERTKIFSLRN